MREIPLEGVSVDSFRRVVQYAYTGTLHMEEVELQVSQILHTFIYLHVHIHTYVCTCIRHTRLHVTWQHASMHIYIVRACSLASLTNFLTQKITYGYFSRV